MKPFKHSKLKNTGVLFELLVRQVTSDTLNNTDSKAIPIIKKYFSKNTELAKELKLYQALVNETFNSDKKAEYLIDVVKDTHSQLNKSVLSRQKFNLIKELKENYVLEDFFKSKINNYRQLATIYKLFEYSPADNPTEFINGKYSLIEHVTRSNPINKNQHVTVLDEFSAQEKDIRLLSYKILVDKFNEKYSNLNEGQRNILKQYINSVSNGTELNQFIKDEASLLYNEIKRLSENVSDKVIRIKLTEVRNILKNIKSLKAIKESHILNMLRYHELIKELKKL